VALRTQLLQNQPNPFNPSTTIRFTLAAEANVLLRVYAADGRMVRTLYRGLTPAGVSIPVQWNGLDEGGRAVPSGLYFYRLVTPNETQTRKMLLLK